MRLVSALNFLVSTASVLYFFFGPRSPWLDVAMWFAVVVSTVYAAEVSMALYRARLWYNVLIVSMAVALPQTIIGVRLAHEGRALAAWIDTIGSTIVDSILVTAVLRREIIGPPMWRFLPYMVIWSAWALYVNYHTYALTAGYYALPGWSLAVAGVALPALLLPLLKTGVSRPGKGEVLMLLNHATATMVASYFLADSLAALEIGEVQLGVVATILATLPDFLVALTIRTAVASILSTLDAEEEAVATMMAAATHDQLLIPAIILLIAPEAAAYYPHLFNLAAVGLKFTLLSRRLYWLVGVPMAVLILFSPPV